MKTLIVDDHSLFADALALALDAHGILVTNAASGAQAIDIVKNTEFDLVLLDMILPDMHGEVLLKSFKLNKPKWKIIVVSSVNVDQSRIASLGADGFINKAESMSSMMQAINSVLGGERHFEAEVDDVNPAAFELSVRQLAVVENMALGLSNKQIAHNLDMSEGAVKQHINRIFKVLDVKNRASCVRKLALLESMGDNHP